MGTLYKDDEIVLSGCGGGLIYMNMIFQPEVGKIMLASTIALLILAFSKDILYLSTESYRKGAQII